MALVSFICQALGSPSDDAIEDSDLLTSLVDATASIIGSGKIGTNYTLRLSDALPNANTFISVGFSLWSAPFDLSLIQAPGCNMYFNNLLTLNGTCNSIGMSSTNLSIPSSIEPCLRIYFQYFPLDRAANPLGLTTTNYARLLTGH